MIDLPEPTYWSGQWSMPNTIHNAFDVLQLDGKNLTRRPYAERRIALADIAATTRGRIIEFPCNWIDVDPGVVLTATAEMGLEGIVCKHVDSAYLPGRRSPDGSRRHTACEASSSLADGSQASAPTATQ